MVGAPPVAVPTLPSYRISLARVDDGADEPWLAEVDGLSDCSARGATPDAAVRRVWANVLERVGPEEESEPPSPRHSGRLLVRMPATLHDELALAAEAEGVSLNQLITGVLAGAVEWRSTTEGRSSRSPGARLTARSERIVLVANFAVVLLVAVVAIALLVTAWRG